MTHTIAKERKATFHLESNWLRYQKPVSRKLAAEQAVDLLSMTATLAGVLRYGCTERGSMLIGECPVDAVANDSRRPQDRLIAWVKDAVPDEPPSEEEVESLLDECVPGCSWQEGHWIVPPDASVSRERIVRLVPGGVSVQAALATWESQERLVREALAEFLWRAQASLRLARLELHETEVRVFSQVETAFLSRDMAHSLEGVAEACRTLGKEVAALAVPELANAYLEFLKGQEATE